MANEIVIITIVQVVQVEDIKCWRVVRNDREPLTVNSYVAEIDGLPASGFTLGTKYKTTLTIPEE